MLTTTPPSNSDPKWGFHDYFDRVIRPLNRAILAVLILSLGFVLFGCRLEGEANPRIWLMVLLAPGGLGMGAMLGLLFARSTSEEKMLSPLVAGINGVIGGVTLTDLPQSDSLIRGALTAIAEALGMPNGGGLVFLVLAAFMSIGFIGMYLNKSLLLNQALALQNLSTAEVEAARKQIEVAAVQIASDPEMRPQPSDQVRSAAQRVVDSSPSDDPDSVDTLMLRAKSLYVLNMLSESEIVLRDVLARNPDNPDALFYLANVLIRLDRHAESVPYLERATEFPGGRTIAWKLLGYALLFAEGEDKFDRLKQSLTASEAYLKIRPTDSGAHFNMACAYAQLSTLQEPQANVRKALDRLKVAIDLDPIWRLRAIQFSQQPDDDFFTLKDNKKFRVLCNLDEGNVTGG